MFENSYRVSFNWESFHQKTISAIVVVCVVLKANFRLKTVCQIEKWAHHSWNTTENSKTIRGNNINWLYKCVWNKIFLLISNSDSVFNLWTWKCKNSFEISANRYYMFSTTYDRTKPNVGKLFKQYINTHICIKFSLIISKIHIFHLRCDCYYGDAYIMICKCVAHVYIQHHTDTDFQRNSTSST